MNVSLSLLPAQLPMSFDVNNLRAVVSPGNGTQELTLLPSLPDVLPRQFQDIGDFTTQTESKVIVEPQKPDFAAWPSAFIAGPIFAAATATAIVMGIRMLDKRTPNSTPMLPIQGKPVTQNTQPEKRAEPVSVIPKIKIPLIDTIRSKPENWAFVSDYHAAYEIALEFSKTDPENIETVLKLTQSLGNAIGEYLLHQQDMSLSEFCEIQEHTCQELGITDKKMIAAAIHVLGLMGGFKKTSLDKDPAQIAFIDSFEYTFQQAKENTLFLKSRYHIDHSALGGMYKEISQLRDRQMPIFNKDIPEFERVLSPEEILHSLKHRPDQWQSTSIALLYYELKKLMLQDPEHGAKVAMLVQNWGLRIEGDTRINIAEMFKELVFASLDLPFYVKGNVIFAAMQILALTLTRNHEKMHAATGILGDELVANPDMTPEQLINTIGH
ncbi:MAG: hypothetical protein ABII18_04445 [bacterium]|nr:hypothetical protein [bacterium]MBU1918069.1 hypothetical protein [bacterium]